MKTLASLTLKELAEKFDTQTMSITVLRIGQKAENKR